MSDGDFPEPLDLSILIVNWNGAAMLRQLLASIDATRGNLRVQTIVVDNASTDGSPDLVAREFPRVILLRNSENAGFARGNNQAAAAAKAPLLLLLNNDTIVRPGALQKLVEVLRGNPSFVAAGPKLIGGDGKPQRSGRNLPTFRALLNSIQFLKATTLFRADYDRYRRGGFDPQTSSSIAQLAAAALLIRTEAFNDCGKFDEGFAFGVEDVDLCKRLAAFGTIRYVSDAAIEHLGRVSSRAQRAFVYRSYECGWARYLRKHHGVREARIYKTLVTLDMPIRVIVRFFQWLFDAIGQSPNADRARDSFIAAAKFMFTGLPQFWRA
jgi:N-acetylglucosaminyl-diphospho-decaprenol L-rhamnosyltransferase